MSANPYHGEVSLGINGETLLMRLNLGTLAALETSMGDDSLLALVERFETAQFKSEDIITLICAGLKGAGWQGTRQDILDAKIEGGPLAAARAAGELLRVTFGMPE